MQAERTEFRDKIGSLEDDRDAKQNQLDEANREIRVLADENHRLKNTVVNKDS